MFFYLNKLLVIWFYYMVFYLIFVSQLYQKGLFIIFVSQIKIKNQRFTL